MDLAPRARISRTACSTPRDALRAGVAADARRCTFQRWTVSLASARRADVVVTGHTHGPLRTEDPNALFLNSGSCAEGRFSFLSLDTARGAYAVNQGFDASVA